MTEPRVLRTVRRFGWCTVEEKLLRAMLVAVYSAADRPDEVRLVRRLSRNGLDQQAERALGRPLSARHIDVLFEVLRASWLLRLESPDLDVLIWDLQLSLRGPDRTADPRSKKARLEFLRRQRRTPTYDALLRAAFIRHHKIEREVNSGGRGPSAAAARLPIDLVGMGLPAHRVPYPHQVAAWEKLDALASARSMGKRRGLLVLPTGAGKTYTMVSWLLRRMAAQPDLRVLWVADQQELLDQAARAFNDYDQHLPSDFQRRLRVIHGAGNRATTLADPELDVACITRQSLVGQRLDAAARKRLQAFLSRPCVVVVDEAHHAVAKSYDQMFKAIQEAAPRSVIVGLTATPWPRGAGLTVRLCDRFPVRVADLETRDLVQSGVLARPILHTVHTGEWIDLEPLEVQSIMGRDLPGPILRKLDRRGRNDVIVRTWLERREEWGKTLLFACDIDHANHLGNLFTAARVDTTVVHTRAEVERGAAIRAFGRAPGPSVLISVGMLLEGVDIPDARTAFLARPTTSRIVMRQMVGRVLRGVASGGEAFAHVVDLRDRWGAEVDILEPVDLGDIGAGQSSEGDRPNAALPPVLDELSGEPIDEGILRRIERAYDEFWAAYQTPALVATTLIGFYELGDRNVPVFEHTHDAWGELIAARLKRAATGHKVAIDYFDDLPVPRPVKSDVDAVVEFVRSHEVEPPLVEVRSTLSLRGIAREIVDAGPLTEAEKVSRLLAKYESSLARSEYFSFQAFWEAVQRQILGLTQPQSGLDPEAVEVQASTTLLPKLTRISTRDLVPLLRRSADRGRELLRQHDAAEYVSRLTPQLLPRVIWTTRPGKGAFGYWAPRISGLARGEPIIRINVLLRAPKTQVPDEMLEYLLWHELCHQLLPGRGHDAEFRWLESRWPGSARLDHEIDTLQERYNLDW